MNGNRLLNTDVEDLVHYVVEKYRVDVPERDEANMSRAVNCSGTSLPPVTAISLPSYLFQQPPGDLQVLARLSRHVAPEVRIERRQTGAGLIVSALRLAQCRKVVLGTQLPQQCPRTLGDGDGRPVTGFSGSKIATQPLRVSVHAMEFGLVPAPAGAIQFEHRLIDDIKGFVALSRLEQSGAKQTTGELDPCQCPRFSHCFNGATQIGDSLPGLADFKMEPPCVNVARGDPLGKSVFLR